MLFGDDFSYTWASEAYYKLDTLISDVNTLSPKYRFIYSTFSKYLEYLNDEL